MVVRWWNCGSKGNISFVFYNHLLPDSLCFETVFSIICDGLIECCLLCYVVSLWSLVFVGGPPILLCFPENSSLMNCDWFLFYFLSLVFFFISGIELKWLQSVQYVRFFKVLFIIIFYFICNFLLNFIPISLIGFLVPTFSVIWNPQLF